MNHLLNQFDMDPGKWRPLYYQTFIDVQVEEGGIGRGSITLNNMPFIFTRLGHQVVGNIADPETSGLYDDGMYTIEFKDEQSNYYKDPILAEPAFGSVNKGFLADLAFPIPYAGNRTINFRIENLVTRTLSPEAETFKVGITCIGVANWGDLFPAPGRR